MTQGTFQSFTDPNSPNYKSPEERKQYIIALTCHWQYILQRAGRL